MSKRMEILFGQKRYPQRAFATFELEEILSESAAEIEKLAEQESWASFDTKEIGPDGEVEIMRLWDALSMPYETRKQIAYFFHIIEDDEKSLLSEGQEESAKIQTIFSWADTELVSEAFFCARLFTYALDAAVSLKLSLVDSLEVLCHAYGMPADRIIALNNVLDNGKPCSFVLMDEDTRFAALLLYLLKRDGLLAQQAEHVSKFVNKTAVEHAV